MLHSNHVFQLGTHLIRLWRLGFCLAMLHRQRVFH
uniref:Uncharacterized protein n=1 Tax=Siphoviridae sp. ctCS019 TaxID=2825378 RepID=A0A8S5U5Q6_9CAUD|nr:MAG TPA: hypothetical protein [Siphoviridae sp. ctCS019]